MTAEECRDNGPSRSRDSLQLSASSLPQEESEAGRGGSCKRDHAPSASSGERSRAWTQGRGLRGGTCRVGPMVRGGALRTATARALGRSYCCYGRPRLQGLCASSPETWTRPPCLPRRRSMAWVWSGRTMAVSAGGLGVHGRRDQARVFPGAQPGGCAGWLGTVRTRKSSWLYGWQQGWRPRPLELRRRRVGTWRPQPSLGAAAGEPHPAPPPVSSTEIGEDGLG